MRCLFDQPVGDGDIDRCPRWADDCPCKLDIIRHGLGEVDEQTTIVVAWWSGVHTFRCSDGAPREKLPQFR